MIACGDCTVLVVGVIRPDLGGRIALMALATNTCESPLVAWRRIKACAPHADLRLLVAHGPSALARQLEAELGPRDPCSCSKTANRACQCRRQSRLGRVTDHTGTDGHRNVAGARRE